MGDENGNYVRPMFQEFDDVQRADSVVGPRTGYGFGGWCATCHVAWKSISDPCWSCHAIYYGPLRYFDAQDVNYYEIYPYDYEAVVEKFELDCKRREEKTHREILGVLKEEPRPKLDATKLADLEDRARRITRIFNDFGESALEAANAINGAFAGAMRQAFISYSEVDAQATRRLVASIYGIRVETDSDLGRIAFDVETFETDDVVCWFGANRPRERDPRRNFDTEGRMEGLRAHRIWIDEWVSETPTLTAHTTKDGVTITLPRDVLNQRRVPPAPVMPTGIIERIATQHRQDNPVWYNESSYQSITGRLRT
jgi:hypothetical protein